MRAVIGTSALKRLSLRSFVRYAGRRLRCQCLFPPAGMLIFRERIVRIAVDPTFAGLGGCDHRMSAGVRVFAGVLIR